MKKVLLLAMLLLSFSGIRAQLATNRMRAHYRLTPERMDSIESKGYYLRTTTERGVRYTVRGFDKPFKFLATLKDGAIQVDPWSLSDPTHNSTRKDSVVAKGDTIRWMRATTNPEMVISLKRSTLYQKTKVVKIPYRAWTLMANSIAIKVRPAQKNEAGEKYSANVSSAFNLGLAYGYTFGKSAFTHRTQINTSHTFGLGLGFGAAALSKEPLKRTIDATYTPSNMVLSPNLSYTVARNDIGLVLAVGIDSMTGAQADAWLYQNRLFWGFGLSYGLKL